MDWYKQKIVEIDSIESLDGYDTYIRVITPLPNWLETLTEGHLEEKIEKVRKLLILVANNLIENKLLTVDEVADYLGCSDRPKLREN